MALPRTLSQSGGDGGGLPAGTEPAGGLSVHSMKNSTAVFSESLESYLMGMNETNPTSQRVINETLRNSPSGQTL